MARDRRMGPGTPCVYCHETYGQHLENCPQIEADRESLRIEGEEFRMAIEAGDDVKLGMLLRKLSQ